MSQSNFNLLRKFETMKTWMIEDTKRAMFNAQANFLVAQGLFNYTEIVGSFVTSSAVPGERFDAFFRRMGIEYENLLKRHNGKRRDKPHVIYDDLRCGLTHEYAIKRKNFTVYNSNTPLTDRQINGRSISINGVKTKVTAGVMHSWTSKGKGMWHVIDPKYWLDFSNALDIYWQEVNNPTNSALRQNFFRRAREINFINFV